MADARPGRQRDRHVEGEEPVLAVGLDRDGIAHRARGAGVVEASGDGEVRDPPGLPVELPEHGASPVERVVRGDVALELHAEGGRLRLDELGDVARRHRVRQPRQARARVLGQGPEGPLHAREQDEEDEHEGHRLQQQQARGHEALAHRGRAAHAPVVADEGRHEEPHAGEHVEAQRNGLREEEVRHDEDEPEVDGEHHLARGLHLEELHRGHEDEERRAGVAAHDPAVDHPGRRDGAHRQDEDEPPRGRARRPPRDPPSPCEHEDEEDADPFGEPQRVGRDDEGHRGQEPHDVPHVERGIGHGEAHGPGSSPWSASASRQRARCASPRPGAIDTPGRRRP